MKASKTKSPLKDKPLRYVAQSADEALDKLLLDKILMYYVAGTICLMGILWDWLRYFQPINHPPILISIILGSCLAVCGYKIYKEIRKVKALKLGRDGERAVGQYLESLRESGCHVFHDIVGDGFNVDHVVISKKGIYVVETKTYSKPSSGKAVINFDGERVLINGKKSLTDVVTQAKAASGFIKQILKESTGKEFEPFPVVLFPGWCVEGEGNKQGKMWVLEPKAFKKFVAAQRKKLSAEDLPWLRIIYLGI
ncbi:MAG: NERD domain-containing protein [Desulfobulbaceae bacterium]|nr:NERD domain-containing protein [Desulfobulbaceae bacterium]